ncbi:hypothetical protein [Blastococcus sp. VKM Ac-2987]|uniref:hypothetical protein n=1 Tax=Blastococcus sp. VKM Ac-2987 TaxID=3004141 RepID=UPI0022AB55CE|nr:hypothetical protein [Blastococcus sp. VKM Ac-2987]MCZ2857472.1 hypothetical protein [Blastococcus sp. VKM Ac-2987]
MAPNERHFCRVGAIAAALGIVIYVVSALLHPWTPPHETETAFADYASEGGWALYHLGEFLGILFMSGAVLALAYRLRRGVPGVWAFLGAAAMLLCAGVYAVFAAVDGVALGVMVRRWAEAGPDERGLLYETAFAVRQVEGGLFSLQWLLFGIAAGLLAVAFFTTARGVLRGGWSGTMAWLSVVASFGALSFAITQAQTGYSDLSMTMQLGLYLGFAWIAAVGLYLFLVPEQPESDPTANGDRAHQDPEMRGRADAPGRR